MNISANQLYIFSTVYFSFFSVEHMQMNATSSVTVRGRIYMFRNTSSWLLCVVSVCTDFCFLFSNWKLGCQMLKRCQVSAQLSTEVSSFVSLRWEIGHAGGRSDDTFQPVLADIFTQVCVINCSEPTDSGTILPKPPTHRLFFLQYSWTK